MVDASPPLIRIDELPAAAAAMLHHILPADNHGSAEGVTVDQIRALIAAIFDPNGHEADAFDLGNHTGVITNTGLPKRLRAQTWDNLVADWNLALENGHYGGDLAANGPTNGQYVGRVTRSDNYLTQSVSEFAVAGNADTKSFQRHAHYNGASWDFGAWYRLRQSEDEIQSLINASVILPTLSNNVADIVNDVDFSSGKALDSTRTIVIPCAAMTKRLDGNWAPGTGNGGRYSGAALADVTYHGHTIAKAGGAAQDYYLDPSPDPAIALAHVQAEPGGAGYVYASRIGSILREAGAIVLFKQDGDLFMRSPVGASSNNPGTAAQTITLKVPTGIRVCALLNAGLALNSAAIGEFALVISDLALPDFAPTTGSNDVVLQTQASGVWRASAPVSVMTNTSAQVRARLSASVLNLLQAITIRGWIDRRIT